MALEEVLDEQRVQSERRAELADLTLAGVRVRDERHVLGVLIEIGQDAVQSADALGVHLLARVVQPHRDRSVGRGEPDRFRLSPAALAVPGALVIHHGLLPHREPASAHRLGRSADPHHTTAGPPPGPVAPGWAPTGPFTPRRRPR